MLCNEKQIRVKCASMPDLVTKLSNCGIVLKKVQYIDDLTFTCQVSGRNYKAAVEVFEKCGAEVSVCSLNGIAFKLRQLLKRPVLSFGVLLLLALTLYLPGRILFVCVTGNENLPSGLIVEKAAECGVSFGTRRSQIRSEKIKNILLSKIPELQWVGINTYGCTAVISVQENKEHISADKEGVARNIIACRDGIVSDISVTKGNALCKVGQAVKQGQLLVSGVVDYGICLKDTGADGEVYANTGHVLNMVSPKKRLKKASVIKKEKRFSLILGKKLINLYKGSGISGANCDRMYSWNYIVLPGGLQLPISVLTEEIIYYEVEEITIPDDEMIWLDAFAEKYLLSNTIAGEILKKNVSVEFGDASCKLYGVYRCRELISRQNREGA